MGFTIIELMVAVAVLAILVSLAAPSMRATLQNNRATAQANQLVTALNLARSEAVKRGSIVALCSSEDGNACRTDDAFDWSDGWILFDDNNDALIGDPVINSPDEVLRAWGALAGDTTLGPNSGSGFARFGPQGRLIGANTEVFQLRIPGCSGDQNRDITVRASGRVQSERVDCS